MRRHSSQLAKDHGEMIGTHAGFSGESGERVAGCEVVIERFSRAIDPARIPLELRRPVQASFPADDVEHTVEQFAGQKVDGDQTVAPLQVSRQCRRRYSRRLVSPFYGNKPTWQTGRGNERNSISTCQARRNR